MTHTDAVVLVVDDELICREAAAQILRAHGYHVVTADSGFDAMRLMGDTRIDLVLLDVCMPEVDGLAFLQILRKEKQYARLPVILLTEHSDVDMVRRAGKMHVSGYLLKSGFTAETLLARVSAALAPPGASDHLVSKSKFQALPTADATNSNVMTKTPDLLAAPSRPADPTSKPPSSDVVEIPHDRVLAAIHKHVELQAESPAYNEVMKLTSNPGSSSHDIVEALRHDGVLALRVLKVANSALYSTGTRAKTLADAVGRLGLLQIRNAVATASIENEFGKATGGGLVPQRTWEHALAVAMIARSLAARTHPGLEEVAFLAGLLHDVGRMVLSSALPNEFAAAMTAAAANPKLDPTSFELKTFGFTHAEVTRMFLEYRRLDANIVDAAVMHDRRIDILKRSTATEPENLIVALANRIAHAYALGDGGSPLLLPLDRFANALGVDGATIAEISRSTANHLLETELYYGCLGSAGLLPPFVNELAANAHCHPRVKVISRDARLDAVSILVGELGWTAEEDYDMVVVSAPDISSAQQSFNPWIKMRDGGEMPVLFIISDDDDGAPREPVGSVGYPVLSLPMRYSYFINTIASMTQAADESRAAALSSA